MRERLSELLPLLLVGVFLLAFQLTRDSGPSAVFRFLPMQEQVAPTSTPIPAAAATVAPRTHKATRTPTSTPARGLCSSASPNFVGGMAELKSALGASMG